MANIILNGERLKALPLRLGTRQRCLLFATFIQLVLEGLASPSQLVMKKK